MSNQERLLKSRDLHRNEHGNINVAYINLHNLCLEASQLLRQITDGWEGQDEALTDEYVDKICEICSRLAYHRWVNAPNEDRWVDTIKEA